MSWSNKYKRSINCDNPSGFSQRAHCAARKKRQQGEKTKSTSPFNEMHEVKTHKSVEEIAKKHRLEISFVKRQLQMGIPIEHEHTKDKDLATDIALQHLDEIPDYYTRLKKMEASAKKEHKKFKDMKEESLIESRRDNKGAGDPGYSLRDWFKGGGWIQVAGKYKGKPCAKQPGQKTKPFCRDADDAAAMSAAEKKRRTAKKRKEDPNPNRRGKAKMVREDSCPICQYDPCQCLEGTLQEKKDACYHKVKSRYKVWPSAYASGALVKCRKVGADNWGTKTEATQMIRYCPKCQKDETKDECKYGPKYWEMFSLPSKLSSVASSNPHYHANSPHPGNMPEGYDHEHSMARSELSTIVSAAKRLRKKMKGEGNIEAWVQSKITKAADYLDAAADYVDSGEMSEAKKCWPGYEKKGTQKLFGKTYNRCVKAEGFSNWRADFGLSEDWQKVNRQDKTDGLSQKAVDAYRRENPGSKLQTAVTEKKPTGKRAKRRSNFCRRMKGMKSKLTSAKTARDPDSRINKALRRWNCN
jgi:hypothetical protein